MQKRRLILIIVAYHPASGEVHRLRSCLQELGDDIGYVVVANDYRQSEPVDLLAEDDPRRRRRQQRVDIVP